MLSTYKTILSQKIQLNLDTYFFRFNLLEPKEIKFRAGQYLMIKIPTDKGPISRLYSIASANSEKNHIEFIIQIIPGGLASSYLSGLKVQDEVSFQGPAGLFELKENDRQKIFLVTGTGIAPILSIIKSNFQFSTASWRINFQLFWGLKTYSDVYLLDELKQYNLKICLSREQNLDMIPKDDMKYFELGHVNSCFEKLHPTNYTLRTNFDFYLCGGRNIVESLKQFLLGKDIQRENIHFEKF